MLTVDASVLRRAVEVEPGLDEPGSRYDLASSRLGHRSFGGAVSGEGRYTVTATEVEEKERYVTVENGVEITRVVSTGRFVPVTDLSAGTRWNVAFRSSGGARSSGRERLQALPLRRVAGDGRQAPRGEHGPTTAAGSTSCRRTSSRGRRRSPGRSSARHVVRYSAPGGRLSLRLSLQTRDELDRCYTNASDTRKERAGTVDVKLARGRSVVYRVQADLASRDQLTSGAGSSYEIREGALLAEVTASAGTEIELRLTGSVGTAGRAAADVDVTIVRVTPERDLSPEGPGHALALGHENGGRERGSTSLPLYLGQGSPPGVTSEWRLSGDYRLNRYLTSSVSYTGEARPDAETRHTLDMRVNAYF